MTNTTLTRSTAFWLHIVLSIAAIGSGSWLVASQIGTMSSTLLDGTATGIEVYVGQAWVTVGAALLGAGAIGLLLALALAAARSLIPAPASSEIDSVQRTPAEDDDAEPDHSPASDFEDLDDATPVAAGDSAEDDDAQNGSSGSTAIATNSSVR